MTNAHPSRTAAATSAYNRRTALRFATVGAAGLAAMALPGLLSRAAADELTDVVVEAPDTDLLDEVSSSDVMDATTEAAQEVVSEAATAAGALTTGGYTKPDASNTGIRAGSTLTVRRGDIVITEPGTVLENLDIFGFVKIRAANVVIRNCRVRGSGPGRSNTGLIDCNHGAVRNALIEDCLLVPDSPSVWLDGVIGKEYTARRCNVYNTVDGFGVYNISDRSAPANVTIESCFIHDLSYFKKDPNHGNGPTHNDGIQIQGGSHIVVRGNNIQGFLSKTAGQQNWNDRRYCQGILIQPNVAPITDSDFSYNWFDGCKVHLHFTSKGGKKQTVGRVRGNRSGTNQYKYHGTSTYQIRVKKGVSFTNSLTENVWDATGVAFKEGTKTGIRYE